MATKDKRIQVVLDEETRERFREYCEERGGDMSTMLRILIKQAISGGYSWSLALEDPKRYDEILNDRAGNSEEALLEEIENDMQNKTDDPAIQKILRDRDRLYNLKSKDQ